MRIYVCVCVCGVACDEKPYQSLPVYVCIYACFTCVCVYVCNIHVYARVVVAWSWRAALLEERNNVRLAYVTPEKVAKSQFFMDTLEKVFKQGRLNRCVCVCVYVCVYVCVCVCSAVCHIAYVCVYVRIYIYIYVLCVGGMCLHEACILVYVTICDYMYPCMYVCIYMCLFVRVYIYIYMCVCVCVCLVCGWYVFT